MWEDGQSRSRRSNSGFRDHLKALALSSTQLSRAISDKFTVKTQDSIPLNSTELLIRSNVRQPSSVSCHKYILYNFL